MYTTNDLELAHVSSVFKEEYLVDMLLLGLRFFLNSWISAHVVSKYLKKSICHGLKRLNFCIYLSVLSCLQLSLKYGL